MMNAQALFTKMLQKWKSLMTPEQIIQFNSAFQTTMQPDIEEIIRRLQFYNAQLEKEYNNDSVY